MQDNPNPFDGSPGSSAERPDFAYPEAEYRRPDFVGGIPVRMIDGQCWHFAEPRMRFAPADTDYGFEIILSLDDDGSFNDMVDRYYSLSRLTGEEFRPFAVEHSGFEIRIARALLERNYCLPMNVLRGILQTSHDESDAKAAEICKAVARAVLGDVPKPSAGGDEPSATPPACSDSTTAC